MGLRSLQVTDFRCLQRVVLDLDPAFTFIWGPNASGKTSLLEAIYLLGRGRSFRTRQLDHLTRQGRSRFVVYGEVIEEDRMIPMGIEGQEGQLKVRIDGRNAAGLAELALRLPVQIVDPEVHKLIEEGPGRRRRFLDWGVFHVEPTFARHWSAYQQALRQRNAALKARQPKSIVAVWDRELIHHGEALTEARRRYVDALRGQAAQLGRTLLGREVTLSFRRGWLKDLEFAEALNRSWETDWERGATSVGPQRAELQVVVEDTLARDHVSRGQQKLLAASLLLAQLALFDAGSTVRPLLLLDDPAAELDERRLGLLIEVVRQFAVQLVVTSLRESVDVLGRPGQVFRMSGGQILPG